MKHLMSSVLLALCLLLSALTAVLWARNLWITDGIDAVVYFGSNMGAELKSWHGRLTSTWVQRERADLAASSGEWRFVSARVSGNIPEDPGWKYLGFGIYTYRRDGGRLHMTCSAVPHWSILAFSSIGTATTLLAWQRRRMARRAGLCPSCGHDLHASKDRCPECGTLIPAQTASSGGKA